MTSVVGDGVTVQGTTQPDAPAAARPDAGRASLPYEPALNGLRAVAVSAVVLYHGIGLTSDHLGRGGFLGVDVFFVLSGYLITSLLLLERSSTGRINLAAFWVRRARRLFPALLAMLAVVIAYALLVATSSQQHEVRSSIVPTLLYFENWHMIGRRTSLVSHTWSLAIEEQWYLVWPIVLSLVIARVRKPTAPLLAGVGALTVASALWTAHVFAPLDSRAYLSTVTRGQALLVGAGLAILLAIRGRVVGPRALRAIEAGGFAGSAVLLWAFATWRPTDANVFRGGLLLVALASAMVIVAATQPGAGGLRRVLSTRPLVAVGVVSYGIYLYDPPMIAWFDESRTHLSAVPLFIVRLLATGTAAFVSWKLIERPFLKAAVRRRWPWVAMLAAVGCVLVGTFAIDPGPTPASGAVSWNDVLKSYAKAAASAPKGTQRVLVVGGDVANAIEHATPGGAYRHGKLLAEGVGVGGCGVASGPVKLAGDRFNPSTRCAFAPGLLIDVVHAFRPGTVAITIEDRDRGNRLEGTRVIAAGSPEWIRDSFARLDGFRARLPATVTNVVIVDGCRLSATPSLVTAVEAAAATGAWRSYAELHKSGVSLVEMAPGVCASGPGAIGGATWRALERHIFGVAGGP